MPADPENLLALCAVIGAAAVAVVVTIAWLVRSGRTVPPAWAPPPPPRRPR